MSLFDRFFQAGPQQAPVQAPAAQSPQQPAPAATTTQPTTPGNIPASATATGGTTPGAAPNGTVPATGPTPEGSPLDQFNQLWQTADTKGQPQQPKGVFGNITPEVLAQQAKSMNFTQGINPELLQRAAAGGQDGVQAMMEAINHAAQQAFVTASFASTQFVDRGIDATTPKLESMVSELVRKTSAANTLAESNPVLSQPAVKPVVDMIRNQFASQYPTASPAEIAKMTSDYMTTLSSAFSGAPTAKPAGTEAPAPQAGQPDNWLEFLGPSF